MPRQTVMVVVLLVVHGALGNSDIRLPPSITTENERELVAKVVYPEEVIILNCRATGTPDPQYEWMKDGAPLDINNPNIAFISDGNIEIKFSAQFEGTYQCSAFNQWGKAFSTKTIIRIAKLEFQESTLIHKHPDLGASLKLPCSGVESTPMVERYSWLTQESELDQSPVYLKTSRRVSFGLDGSLYFAYVKSEDSSDRMYKCVARNGKLGTSMEGSPARITVEGTGSLVNRKPSRLEPDSDRTEVLALRGKNARLKCFFGGYADNAAPTVNWDFSSPAVPAARINRDEFESVLEVLNVEYSDEGNYLCWGSNSAGSSPKTTIHVKVESEPMFIDDHGLSDVSGYQGGTATFTCNADAKPQAQVNWYINGEYVNPKDAGALRRVDESLNTLTFTNLCKLNSFCPTREPDLLAVQCNASNIHGYLYKSAFLNVLLPAVIETTETHIKLDRNQTNDVIFPCKCSADPALALEVSWWHEGVRIYNHTYTEFTITPDNSLHISVSGALSEDPDCLLNDEETCKLGLFTGDYECQASAGSTTASVKAYLYGPDYVPTEAPIVASIADYWWVFVIAVAVVLLIILIILLCLWCKRNEQFDYPVDDYERKTGNNPEKELEDDGFHDYIRPQALMPSNGRKNSTDSDGWDDINSEKASLGSKHSTGSRQPIVSMNASSDA